MMKNIGNLDKFIRIVATVAIGGWGVYAHSLWGLVAIVPLVTAASGTCLLYLPFGIRTCPREEAKS